MRAQNIPYEELVVVGGAALQVFGIKKTKDIDLVVPTNRMEQLVAEAENKSEHWKTYHKHLGRLGSNLTVVEPNAGIVLEAGDEYSTARRGNVSFMLPPNDHLYCETFAGLVEDSVMVQGINVLMPDAVLAWKRAVGRPKDIRDATSIQRYLDNAPTSEEFLRNSGITMVHV